MLEDSLDISSYARDHITGDLTVELFDAKTGKLQDKQEVHNFIARPAAERLEWGQRWFFKEGMHALNATADQDYRPFEVFNGIYLSGNTDVEDPTNEKGIPLGHFIGGADKNLYSGSSTLRGSPNGALSRAEPTFTRWVFDWPTNAANGVIGSVGWTNWASVNIAEQMPFVTHTTFVERRSNQSVPNSGHIARSDDGYFMTVANTNTIRILNASFLQTATFTASLFTIVTGVAWDSVNSKLWIIGYLNTATNYRIASYSSSGVVIDSATTISTSRSYAGLTFDGTRLLTTVRSSNASTFVYGVELNGVEAQSFEIKTSTYEYMNGWPETVNDICYDASTEMVWVYTSYNRYGSHPSASGTNGQYYTVARSVGLIGYDISGRAVTPVLSLEADAQNSPISVATISPTNSYVCGFEYEGDGVFLVILGNYASRIRLNNLGSRALLPSPIAKTDTQTLRVTYQMNYT